MMKSMELKIPPAALWLALAVIIILVSATVPSANLSFLGNAIVAIVLLILGGIVMVAGVVEFRRAKTTVNPLAPQTASSIVTTGVYRYTRNPMYLGMAITLLGIVCWKVNLLGLLLVPIFCAFLTYFQIKPEERALVARFGAPFRDYMTQVRRWL